MADPSTILVSIHGPDHPGISAGLMDVLAESGAEVYDVEQIVVRGRLTLNVLVGVNGGKAAMRDLLMFGWEEGLHVEFEVVEPQPTPAKTMTVVTVLGERIGPDDFGVVARSIANGGGNIERIFRLSRYPVVSYELAVSNGDVNKIREQLIQAAAERPIDIAMQPEGLERRAKRLVVLDVDSTLIQNEVIDLLAIEAGVGEQVAAITAAAMRGETDFEASLRERVALLKGLDEDAMRRVSKAITVTPGARTFVRTLRRMGMKTAIVSAGFTRFADALAADLGIDYSLSNTLDSRDGVLTVRARPVFSRR
jgi:phosphoserine phosphatase